MAAGNERTFVIIEAASDLGLGSAFSGAVSERAGLLTGPDEVRLIGTDLDEIKSLRKESMHD